MAKRKPSAPVGHQLPPMFADPDLVDRIFEKIVEQFPELEAGRIDELKRTTREEFRGAEYYIPTRSPTDRQQLVEEVLRMFNGRNATEIARTMWSYAASHPDVRVLRVADYDRIEATVRERAKKQLLPEAKVTVNFERRRPPLEATPASRKLAAHAQGTNPSLKVVAVFNMVQRTAMAKGALDVMSEDENVPVLKSQLGLRSAYRECQVMGATVHSVPRAGAAVAEVEGLVDEILKVMK